MGVARLLCPAGGAYLLLFAVRAWDMEAQHVKSARASSDLESLLWGRGIARSMEVSAGHHGRLGSCWQKGRARSGLPSAQAAQGARDKEVFAEEWREKAGAPACM